MAINLGIDHGNKNIKTSAGDIFPAGYKKHREKPIGKDVLEFGGAYYTLTSNRIPFTWDKTQNEDFFILTLFAITRHLERQTWYTPSEGSFVEVNLGVGLPPAHFGRLYEQFQTYFRSPRNGADIQELRFHGKTHYIYLDKVYAFVQGYAAALALPCLEEEQDLVIVDIGGMTVDYLLLHNGEPDGQNYGSLEAGIILLYNMLKEWIEGNYGLIVSDENLDQMLRGMDVLPNKPEILSHVKQVAGNFVEDIFAKLRERQIDLRVLPSVIIGGGAVTLQHYLEPLEAVGQSFSLLDDVCANARGYEKLLKAAIYQERMSGDR